MMRNTRACGWVVFLRRRMSPKWEAVIRKRRYWNHFRESLCSLVSFSMWQISASLTAKDSLKDFTSTWISSFERTLYSTAVGGLELSKVDGLHTRVESSKRSDTHSPIPFVD